MKNYEKIPVLFLFSGNLKPGLKIISIKSRSVL